MAHKNKTAGRNWEKRSVSVLANLYNLVVLLDGNLHAAQIGRAEEVDLKLDNRGIDIWFSPLLPYCITRFKYQCKKTLCKGLKSKTIDVQPLFDMQLEESTDIPILFTKIKTRPKGKNQMLYGEVVSMKLEHYLFLLSNQIDFSKQNSTRIQTN